MLPSISFDGIRECGEEAIMLLNCIGDANEHQNYINTVCKALLTEGIAQEGFYERGYASYTDDGKVHITMFIDWDKIDHTLLREWMAMMKWAVPAQQYLAKHQELY